MSLQATRFLTLTIVAGALLLSGCDVNDEQSKVSHDIAALRALLSIDMPLKSARWETFATAANARLVLGPTDFVTLVAQLQPSEGNWFASMTEPTGETFIAPEAARPWLGLAFRAMLEKNKDSRVDMTKQFNCRKYTEKVTSSGRPVDGFICQDSGMALLYLTLPTE